MPPREGEPQPHAAGRCQAQGVCALPRPAPPTLTFPLRGPPLGRTPSPSLSPPPQARPSWGCRRKPGCAGGMRVEEGAPAAPAPPGPAAPGARDSAAGAAAAVAAAAAAGAGLRRGGRRWPRSPGRRQERGSRWDDWARSLATRRTPLARVPGRHCGPPRGAGQSQGESGAHRWGARSSPRPRRATAPRSSLALGRAPGSAPRLPRASFLLEIRTGCGD